MIRLTILLLVCSVLFCCQQQSYQKVSGLTMGTTYTITVRLNQATELAKIKSLIERELEVVNRMMSMFLPESEISRFNASESTEWFRVSEDLYQLLKVAGEVWAKSGGAFDVTVKPLVDLWGFGTANRRQSPPSAEEIATAQKRVGYQWLELHPSESMIRKTKVDLCVDLSAIAKGYGVDRIAERLKRLGINDFLVEIGGEIYAAGKNPEGKKWIVGISAPSRDRVQKIVQFSDYAIATSGSYENYFIWQGKHFSHTIDPATGWPIENQVVSVSVLAANCMYADAWATAFDVLGPEKSLKLAGEEKLALFFICERGEGYEEVMNDLFQGFLCKKD